MATTKRRFDIEVTADDIAQATRSDSVRCVVVQAVARSIPDATRIDVDLQAVRFTIGDQRLLYLTPYTVQGYIVAFDAGDDIIPFGFRLQNPQVSKRRRRTEAGNAINSAQTRARRIPKKSAQDDLATVKDAYRNEAQSVTEPGQRPPRRTFKTKTRHYGHRALRINQD